MQILRLIMVQSQQNETNVGFIQSALSGGVAGGVTRAIAQPLDVLKIRFQLQLEPIKKGSKYSSMLQACKSIIKEEGVRTLWSGHVPAQLLSISYGLLQFSAYEELTQRCKEADSSYYTAYKHWITFANGAIAATIATVASYPFDTIRTRLIAEQKTQKVYKGFMNAAAMIVKYEGVFALYKGLGPSIAQIGPHAGIQFAVYKTFTENIFNKISFFQRANTLSSVIESSLFANLIAGSIAGLVSKTAIYPFDVVKKRLQIQGFQHHRKHFGKQMFCKGPFHCLKLIITEEGILGIYKGYGPSLLKAVVVSALHFTIYDEIKHYVLKIS